MIEELEQLRRPVVHISSTGRADVKIRKQGLPDAVIVVDNAFSYTTDELSRVVLAAATLTLRKPGSRNKRAQRFLRDKLDGDDAGHLVARVLGGIGNELNLAPMLRDVNQRQMARMEKRWKEAIDQGKTVDLEIELEYEDESRRPTEFVVSYKVEGQQRRTVVLENQLPEESDQ